MPLACTNREVESAACSLEMAMRFLSGNIEGQARGLLSKTVGPPSKAPYIAPVAVWLMGFFIMMAFAGRGKLSLMMVMMDAISVGYLLMLPAYLLAALLYNSFVRPKKKRDWEARFMCQKCGFVFNRQESAEVSSVASP